MTTTINNLPLAKKDFELIINLINYEGKSEKSKELTPLNPDKLPDRGGWLAERSIVKGTINRGHASYYLGDKLGKNLKLTERRQIKCLRNGRELKDKVYFCRLRVESDAIVKILEIFKYKGLIKELYKSNYYINAIKPVIDSQIFSHIYAHRIINRFTKKKKEFNIKRYFKKVSQAMQEIKKYDINLPPSFLIAYFNEEMPEFMFSKYEGRLKNVTFQEVLSAFYIHDYFTEKDPALKEEYGSAINIIKQLGD